MERFIKYTKVNPIVKQTSAPAGVTVIDMDGLESVVDNVLTSKSKDGGFIGLKKKEVKQNIYEWVLEYLRSKKLFYHGLNLNTLVNLMEKISFKYIFKDDMKEEDVNDLFEEFDTICWKKVNGLPFPEDKYLELKKKLDIDYVF